MLEPGDLIKMPSTPDLARASIDSTCRSLPYQQLGSGNQKIINIRQIVVDQVCELSARRYLFEQGIPHHIVQANLFPGPEKYQISLGGRHCCIKGTLIKQRARVDQIHHQPDTLLNDWVSVPKSFFASESTRESDTLVFMFVLGFLALSSAEIRHVTAAGQPIALCHIFPDPWVRPKKWASLRPVELNNQDHHAVSFEAGGQKEDLRFETEWITLESGSKASLAIDFFSLAYLQTGSPLNKPVGVTSRLLRKTYWIYPHQWQNLWIYGLDIWLAGFMTCEEFRRRAGSQNMVGREHSALLIPSNCLGMRVVDLHPFSQLSPLKL